MSVQIEPLARERWYPLTYPGYYAADLSECPSLSYERCRLDVSALRGQVIGLQAVSGTQEGCCTLTDEVGKVLSQWDVPPKTLHIPDAAMHLYLSNDYAKNPDFYILVPEGAFKKPNGLLFYEDFTNAGHLDGNDFFGESPAANCTQDGLLLPTGIEHALVIHKSTALDNWSLTAEITAPTGMEVICLGTRITQDRPCRHASLCCVDLAAGELRLYRCGTGAEMPQEVVQRISLSGLITGGEFTLRLDRVNCAIRASVINPATGAQISLLQPLNEEESSTTVAGGCYAGKMYDSPQVFALSGAPLIRRLYGAAKTTPKVIFFGDSITQGAHNLPENGWAQKCAADIGNSICCGRGSGDIWSCLNQVRTLMPACRPKVMVVTIGTNNRDSTVSLDTVRGLYEKFIHMAEYWGAIPIINCIIASARPHVEGTNQILRPLSALKSRFDLALVEGNAVGGQRILNYYAADQLHLNAAGNYELYRRFMHDFGWLRDL